MKNRIDKKFAELKKKKGKAFIAFVTAGDPSLKTTEDLVVSLERDGVDIIELGVPFSDPLADGPTIQTASQRALKKGVTLRKILDAVSRIRKRSQIPIALMTYYNPVFYYGEARFLKDAKEKGVDGLIVPDLPPEEAQNFIKAAKERNISTIFFLSPTTTKKRMEKIVRVASGFIYYVSLTGVTGARKRLEQDLIANVKRAKRLTKKPICVGFGISNPKQVAAILKVADGAIVGSAIIKEIEKNIGKKDIVKNVSCLVRKLVSGKY